MAGAGRHQEGANLPGDRPLGGGGGEGAHATVDQSDRQAALRYGRAGAGGVFRARTACRISDGGRSAWLLPARSHAAVPASVGPTGGQLLQRSRSHERQGRAAGYLIARGVTRVAPGPPMTMVAGFRYHSLERLSGASRRGPLPVKSCELARFRRLDLLWVASRRGA